MRLVVAAIGRLKQGPERELAAWYRKRAEATGRPLGLRDVEIIEIRESRAHDAERRRVEESIALANVIPEGAIVVVLDQRGREPRQRVAGGAAARVACGRSCDRVLCHRRRRWTCAQPRPSEPSSGSRSEPPLGRINSCASCCSNSSIAPAPFSPAILIIGADRPLILLNLASPICDRGSRSAS